MKPDLKYASNHERPVRHFRPVFLHSWNADHDAVYAGTYRRKPVKAASLRDLHRMGARTYQANSWGAQPYKDQVANGNVTRILQVAAAMRAR